MPINLHTHKHACLALVPLLCSVLSIPSQSWCSWHALPILPSANYLGSFITPTVHPPLFQMSTTDVPKPLQPLKPPFFQTSLISQKLKLRVTQIVSILIYGSESQVYRVLSSCIPSSIRISDSRIKYLGHIIRHPTSAEFHICEKTTHYLYALFPLRLEEAPQSSLARNRACRICTSSPTSPTKNLLY